MGSLHSMMAARHLSGARVRLLAVALSPLWALACLGSAQAPSTSPAAKPVGGAGGDQGAPVAVRPQEAGPPERSVPAEPPAINAVDELNARMTDLAGSGAPSPPLVKKFDDLVKSWKTDLAKSKVRARFDAKTCYAAGCTVTLAFSDPIAFQRSAPIITHADGFRTWRGAKFRSAPIPSAAERAVRTTWIMFAD